MAIKLAISSPIVTLTSAHGLWEDDASVDDLVRVAETADRLGYEYLTASEHVALPAREQDQRGLRYWDPLATLAFLAARTERIRLLTYVIPLPYHHPLAIAKRYGTLDKLSSGRVILGVGVGTLEAEFDLLGAPFERRGARVDDALRALRVSLSTREPEYHGEFYDYEGFVVDPHAVQDRVPLWVGGMSQRSVRRAVELADGWCPVRVRPADAAEWLGQVELPSGFDVALAPTASLDPIHEPGHAQDAIAEIAAVGATIAACVLKTQSLSEYLDALEALATVHAAS